MSQYDCGEDHAGVQNRGRNAAESKKPIATDALVWGFNRPHEVGTVCGEFCDQCGGRTIQTGVNGALLPYARLLIVAPATAEDWQRSNRRRGGTGLGGNWPYHYFVSVD